MNQNFKRTLSVMLAVLMLVCAFPVGVFGADKAIKLDKTSVTVAAGSAVKLKATVNTEGSEPKWKTSDKSVATVSSSGKVTGKKVGKATITATVNKKSAKCTVTVIPGKVKGLKADVNSSSKTATLKWNKVNGAQKYYIYSYNKSTGKYKSVANTAKTSYKISNLKKDRSYCYVVRACAKIGKTNYYGSYSNKLTVKLSPELTSKLVVAKYKEAYKKAALYFQYNEKALDKKQSKITDKFYYKYDGKVNSYDADFYPIKNFKSKAALKKYLRKTFSSKIVNEVVDNIYIEKNGKLYVREPSMGSEPAYVGFKEIKAKIKSISGKKAKVEISCRVYCYEPYTGAKSSYIRKENNNMKYENGNWVFSDKSKWYVGFYMYSEKE